MEAKGILRSIVIFLFSLTGCGLLAHRMLPPVSDMVGARIARIPENPVDIYFLGSSYTDLGVDVEIFMDEMEKLGHPVRAVNLGMYGCREFDKDFLIRKARDRLSEASYIVDESMINWTSIHINPGTVLPRGMSERRQFIARLQSPRSVEWHDAQTLRDLIHYAEDLWPNDQGRRAREIALSLVPTIQHYLPVGRLVPTTYVEPSINHAARIEARPLGARSDDPAAILNDYLQKIGENEALRATPYEKMETPAVAMMRKRMQTLQALGPQYVSLLPPSPTAGNRLTEHVVRLADSSVPVLSYDDLKEHSDLWDPRNRLDYGHLNRPGVEIFSRRLARDFIATVLGEYLIET